MKFYYEKLLPALKKGEWNWIKLLIFRSHGGIKKLWDGIRGAAKNIGEWIWNGLLFYLHGIG